MKNPSSLIDFKEDRNVADIDMNLYINENLTDLSKNLYEGIESNVFNVNNIVLNNNECFYIKDYINNKIIYNKGFYNVIGYLDDDIDLDFLLNNIHPNDIEIVNRISKIAVLYCSENPYNILNNTLCVSYRRQKKDGTYIKVLSQSYITEINDEGVLVKGLTKFADISFIDTSDAVNWTFEAENLNKEVFKNNIYKAYNNFFTVREIEIIVEIAKGYTNNQISEKLYISKHTVATHRKHLFKKSNTHSVEELILFCNKIGVI
jgi:DNA-binding CsgD family transcriptional regulator